MQVGFSRLLVASVIEASSVKFLVKYYKPQLPLRIAINENGTWYRLLSYFLQKVLKRLPLENGLLLQHFEELIGLMEHFHTKQCKLASLNIKYLCYSLKKSVLLRRVQQLLEEIWWNSRPLQE